MPQTLTSRERRYCGGLCEPFAHASFDVHRYLSEYLFPFGDFSCAHGVESVRRGALELHVFNVEAGSDVTRLHDFEYTGVQPLYEMSRCADGHHNSVPAYEFITRNAGLADCRQFRHHARV